MGLPAGSFSPFVSRDLALPSHRDRDDLALHADEQILEADRLVTVGRQTGARPGGRARHAARERYARHLASAAAVQDDERLQCIVEVARGDGEGRDRLVADGAGALEVSDARLVEPQRAERQRLRLARGLVRSLGLGRGTAGERG
jgi:hypothetical protein